MITTLGGHGTEAIIALDPCKPSDTSCREGHQPPPMSGWHFVKPPDRGGVTYLGSLNDHLIALDVGGHQWVFDVLTRKFTKS